MVTKMNPGQAPGHPKFRYRPGATIKKKIDICHFQKFHGSFDIVLCYHLLIKLILGIPPLEIWHSIQWIIGYSDGFTAGGMSSVSRGFHDPRSATVNNCITVFGKNLGSLFRLFKIYIARLSIRIPQEGNSRYSHNKSTLPEVV